MNQDSKNTVLIFIAFVLTSFALHIFSELSIIHYSFKPFEVFFHEIGHGFVSMLFGGEVVHLHLEYNSGSVLHKINPDYAKYASFAGYFSASFFGFLLYISSIYASKWIKIPLVLISAYWFLHVDGIMTGVILAAIMGTFIASWYLKTFGCYLLRFIGVYIMVSSIYSPTYLWAYDSSGDHVSMADYTWLPASFWIVTWFIIGVAMLFWAFKISLKKDKEKPSAIKK